MDSTADLLTATDSEASVLAAALAHNHEIQVKVEACADDLSVANAIVKKRIAAGQTTLSAHTSLAVSESVVSEVQHCADELQLVNQALAGAMASLKHTEIALMEARQELAATEAALTTAKGAEHQARVRALHDATTGLPNRELFDDRLKHAISLAERHNWSLAVMFLDLDGFKAINDTYGHAIGDETLKAVATRLLQHTRAEDTVCRNGGDEFLYLLMNPKGRENIERVAGEVLRNIADPIDVGGQQVVIEVSIGIAVYPTHGRDGTSLVRSADAAMYEAKERPGGIATAAETKLMS